MTKRTEEAPYGIPLKVGNGGVEVEDSLYLSVYLGDEDLARLEQFASEKMSLRDEVRRLEALNADLQSMLAAAKATELQLDARIKELTTERDAARRATRHVPPTVHACGRKLECGGNCVNGAGHNGPCLCIGDVDGEPGTCPA